MRLIEGKDMFSAVDAIPTVFCVTTNGVIRPVGGGSYELVMGAGAALGAKKLDPGLPKHAAEIIRSVHRDGWMGYHDEHGGEVFQYYLQNVGHSSRLDLAFMLVQTKLSWQEPSEPDLVRKSLEKLEAWTKKSPGVEYRLNYPGIGRGGLQIATVRPWVEKLPNNVLVYLK